MAFMRYMPFVILFSLTMAGSVSAEDAKIRIGYPSGLNAQIPIVMEKAGIAAKHQLEASYSGFQNGPPMMEALVSGQLDAVITSPLPPITLSSKLPGIVTIVAALGNSSHSLLVSKESTVQRISDLQGRKIGVSYSTDSHLDLIITLKQLGLDPKSHLDLVNLPPNELPGALDKRLVDAALVRQPQVLRLIETIGARAIQTWPFHFVAIVRTEYLRKNPENIRRFVEAMREAVFYIISNPDEASRWFGEVQRVDPAVVRKVSLENPLYTAPRIEDVSLDITPEFRIYMKERLQAAHEQGFVKTLINISDLIP